MSDANPFVEQPRKFPESFRTGLHSMKAMASPLVEEPMADSISVSRRLKTSKASSPNNIVLSEVNPAINKLNGRLSSETFAKSHPANANKQNKLPDRVPNGNLSISSGDSCSISNFSGSNSRLSNNSGCSISSDEHEGIWTKLQGRNIINITT